MAGKAYDTAAAQAKQAKEEELAKEIAAQIRMKDDARKAVAAGWSKAIFVSDQMNKKAVTKDPEDLVKDAESAYESAVGERAAFDKDVNYLAISHFRMKHTKE